MGPLMFISAMSGGLPASMAATNFCSRSPKVAQSVSTVTLRSLAQFCTCFSRTSLPAMTKLLNSHTRSFVELCALAMFSSTVSPRRGAARDHRGLAEEFAAADDAGIQLCCQVVELAVHHVPLWMPMASRPGSGPGGVRAIVMLPRDARRHKGRGVTGACSSAAADLVDLLHAGVRLLERGLRAAGEGTRCAVSALRLDLALVPAPEGHAREALQQDEDED